MSHIIPAWRVFLNQLRNNLLGSFIVCRKVLINCELSPIMYSKRGPKFRPFNQFTTIHYRIIEIFRVKAITIQRYGAAACWQVFYLWRHVRRIVDSAAIYIMVVKFRNTISPLPPQLSLHRRAALSSNSNGTWSVYSRRTQKAVYIVICLWLTHDSVRGKMVRPRYFSILTFRLYLYSAKFKETVSRDFRPLVFFIDQLPLGPW
jgi:hypothetical protein